MEPSIARKRIRIPKLVFPTMKFYSLSLAAFVDEWITGFILYGMPIFVLKWYPEHTLLDSTLWLYGAWASSYLARPFGLVIMQKLANRYTTNTCLSISLIGWILSSLTLMIAPYFKLSLINLSVLLFVTRFSANFWVAGETMLARYLFVQLPTESDRRHQIANYDRAKVCGYLLAALSVEYCSWHATFIITLSLALLALRWRISADYFYQQEKTISVQKSVLSFTPYIFFGHCVSALAFAIVNTYGHQISTLYPFKARNNNLITTSILFLDVILLTLFKRVKNISNYRTLAVSAFMIGLNALLACFFVSYASSWQMLAIRICLVVCGILFCISFFSTIANDPSRKNQDSIQTLSLAFQYWLSSLLYGKFAPWLLLKHRQNSNFSYDCLIAFIIILPIFVVLKHIYSKSKNLSAYRSAEQTNHPH